MSSCQIGAPVHHCKSSAGERLFSLDPGNQYCQLYFEAHYNYSNRRHVHSIPRRYSHIAVKWRSENLRNG